VNNLPYCEKELANESRNRKGVHVFLHWYSVEFNNLTTKNASQQPQPR